MQNNDVYRVAVCISGQSRTYKSCIQNSKRYFETINIPNKKIQIDYFFHTWDINTWRTSDYERNVVMSTPIDMLADVDITFIQSKLNVVDYRIESYYKYKINATTNNMWSGLFYSMKTCNDLKTNHEKNNNFIYDLVIKTRFDIVHPLTSKFPNHALEDNTAYAAWEIEIFKNELNLLHFQDIIFYGNSNSINLVCSIYENFYLKLFDNNHIKQHGVPKENILGPGTLLHLYFQTINIIPKYISQIPYYIARYDIYVSNFDGIRDIDKFIDSSEQFFKSKQIGIYKNHINVAYNEILAITSEYPNIYVNTNIPAYDVHDLPIDKMDELSKKYNITYPINLNLEFNGEYNQYLNKFTFENFSSVFQTANEQFENYILDDIIKMNIPFIYPIHIIGNRLLDEHETIDIDLRVIERAQQGLAKIVFFQPTEGLFGYTIPNHYKWFSNISNKYNLPKKSLIIITANLIAKQTYKQLCNDDIISDNYTIIQYNYFRENLWFLPPHHPNSIDDVQEYIILNQTKHKTHHFLCFNRIPKEHRLLIFGELKTNPLFKDTYITSMGIDTYCNYSRFKQICTDTTSPKLETILNFYNDYDFTIPCIYDEVDMEHNKANILNRKVHNESFVNIITESLTSKDSVFFSEKTYKPIYMLQPFILFGNPNSLKTLKELGFKTFNKWWDESYDSEIDLIKRFEKITKVMEEIASWSLDKCFIITNEMQEILIHNFNVMIDTTERDVIIKTLSDSNENYNVCQKYLI